MIPAAPGQEPAGFTVGPELWLLLLGVVATIGVALIFFFLMRRMMHEEQEEQEEQEQAGDDEGESLE